MACGKLRPVSQHLSLSPRFQLLRGWGVEDVDLSYATVSKLSGLVVLPLAFQVTKVFLNRQCHRHLMQ